MARQRFPQGERGLRVRSLIVALLMVAGLDLIPALPTSILDATSASHPGRTVRLAQHRAAVSAHRTTSVRTYLIAVGDSGKSGRWIGCGDSLVPVTHSITPTTTPLTAAMGMLLSDHRRYYGLSGLYNALYQSRLRVQRATVVNGRATVHLVGTMRLGGVCDNPRVGAQLRQTARQFPTVRSVAIFINNAPLWRRLSEKGG